MTDSSRIGLPICQCARNRAMEISISARVELVGRSSVTCRERLRNRIADAELHGLAHQPNAAASGGR